MMRGVRRPSPTGLLLSMLVLTLGVIGWLSWTVFDANRTLTTTVATDIRLYELRGIIVHLDEVLTMSARMAAFTGDRAWTDRYNTYVPQLDAAIQEAISLAPAQLAAEIRAETDAANLHLVKLETQALADAEQHRLADAQAVLFSAEYEQQKQVYASGMAKLLAYVQDRVELRQQAQQQRARIVVSVLTVSLVLLLSTWLVVLRSLRSSVAVREALLVTQAREQTLEQTRSQQELVIAERTAELREALRAIEEREALLTDSVRDLRQSEATIRELSAPVLSVLPGVLVVPMIGVLDAERAQIFGDQVLSQVQQQRSRAVILDVTGVPIIDTHVAGLLVNVASALRLLGAETLLVGIRPEIAQTMVALNIDLQSIRVYPRLREAVQVLGARGM